MGAAVQRAEDISHFVVGDCIGKSGAVGVGRIVASHFLCLSSRQQNVTLRAPPELGRFQQGADPRIGRWCT